MSSFYSKQDKNARELYVTLLTITGSLSNLYADTKIPFIYYRAMENIFCKAFEADNLSRSDVSADAGKNGLGIGLKTFLQNNGKTIQKVAEFNKESYLLRNLNDLETVIKVAEMRNERILTTQRMCNLNDMIYHLLTREENQFNLYEEQMDLVDIGNIELLGRTKNTIQFTDQIHEYSFSISKSTLMKRFDTTSSKRIESFSVDILEDPYEFLLSSYKNERGVWIQQTIHDEVKDEYIILPLYSPRDNKVQEKSGLNQWNAGGRQRNDDEVYIQIPSWIHKKFKGFFTYCTEDNKTQPFDVILPNKNVLSMKVAQQGGKALMSNPNSALGNWILRDILKVPYKTLVTKEMLDIIGIDSVMLTKKKEDLYKLDFLRVGSYEDFEEKYNI